MNLDQHKTAAKEGLDHVMSFFPRVDSSMNALFGVDVGMLAVLAANAPPIAGFKVYMIFAAIPMLLLGCSLWQIYHGVFPQLGGSPRSLIYFREIAGRTQSEFIQEFKAQTDKAQLDGLLTQIWTNSRILTKKYQHLKKALIYMAWALVPWLLTLGAFVGAHKHADSLLAK